MALTSALLAHAAAFVVAYAVGSEHVNEGVAAAPIEQWLTSSPPDVVEVSFFAAPPVTEATHVSSQTLSRKSPSTRRSTAAHSLAMSTIVNSPVRVDTGVTRRAALPRADLSPTTNVPGTNDSASQSDSLSSASARSVAQRLFFPTPKPPANSLADDGHGGKVATERRFNAAIAPDGLATLTNSVAYDWTEKMMLRHGDDARSREKILFLDRTRDERVAMAQKYRDDQLGRSSELANDSVQTLWQRRDLSMAEKREDLFELWDDCAEAADGNDDSTPMNPRAAAGERVRTQLIAFIRQHLAAGSDDAYSLTEIEALNKRRHSHHIFAPYPAK